MFVISSVGIYNIGECLVYFLQNMDDVDTYDWHVYVLLGIFWNNLVSFLKGHVDKPVYSSGMF